jgi:uncharacterized protein (TIGR03435 family)
MIPLVSRAIVAISTSLALSIVVKITVIMAVALFAARLARGSRAAVRHSVLATAFGAALVIPIACLVAPPVNVAVPVMAESLTATLPPLGGIEPIPFFTPADARVSVISVEPPAPGHSFSDVLLAGWIAGTVLFLLPMVIGLWQIRSLRRSGLPWPRGQAVVEALARDVGIQRRVKVLLHEALPGPMTCGVLHPAIVLSRDAEDWEGDDLSRAIAHELEHVRRGDSVTRCLAWVACAVYWFHPLVWIGWRRLVLEAERSCDDAVLRLSEATAYAEQLVDLAKRMSMARRSPLLAMADHRDLAIRVGAVLDSGQRRGRLGTFSAALACAAALVLVVAVAPLLLVAAPQATLSPQPAFEVASIRAVRAPSSVENSPNGQFHIGISIDGSRADYGFMSLAELIPYAYGVKQYQVSGPSWMDETRWDILAKIPQGQSADRAPEMMQRLLMERFKLSIHREKRDRSVYALVIGKGGLKIKEAATEEQASGPQPAGIGLRMNNDRNAAVISGRTVGSMRLTTGPNGGMQMEIAKITMAALADRVTQFMDRPVVDATHLKGSYQVTLELPPDAMNGIAFVQKLAILAGSGSVGVGFANPNALDTSDAAMIQAVKRLGLELQSRKAPVETIIVDRVEKTPTAN